MKKLFTLTVLLFSIFSLQLFAQETDSEPQADSDNSSSSLFRKIDALPEEERTFLNTTSMLFELSPGFYLNPDSKALTGQSASPVYPFSFGFIWPNYTSIAIAPGLSFFMMNHLYYNGTAYPAEIENRTSLTFNFILNIPLCVTLFTQKGLIQLAPGIAILPRFAVLAPDVNQNDSGYTGSAQDDVNEINKWFWQNARFLYLSFSGSYLFEFSENVKGGPVIHTYIPLGTIFSGESVQGFIISFGMKVQFQN